MENIIGALVQSNASTTTATSYFNPENIKTVGGHKIEVVR